MGETFTRKEQARILRALDVPQTKIDAALGVPRGAKPAHPISKPAGRAPAPPPFIKTDAAPLPTASTSTTTRLTVHEMPRGLPFVCFVPWPYLVSDNKHFKPALRRVRGGGTAFRLLLTPEYRNAKAALRALARDIWGDAPPDEGALTWHATVYVPDDGARRDIVNFAKCLQDALTGIVYADDSQIVLAVWALGGVRRDHPGCALTLARGVDVRTEGGA